MGAWMTTYTGKKFYPGQPAEDKIDVIDIAHALSFNCRYGGHCITFFSVGEHCCRLYDAVEEDLRPMALMHDSSEAYLLDMPSNLKRELFPEYRVVEQALLEVILKKYGVPPLTSDQQSRFKVFEYRLLATEVRDLMSSSEEWYLPEEPFEERIVPLTPSLVETQFLHRFYRAVSKGSKRR